jgi:nitroimidazol reductase NimA-like FMN-containing flavoprotein (pyridoxamine 5'-phosphate oxidase superfamily)
VVNPVDGPLDPELTVRRLPEKQVFDREALHSIVDEALIAHVATIRNGQPVVLPFACARDGETLLLHGSTGAGVLRIATRASVCVAITHLDGLVFARSLFESSMHYRSVVIHGVAEEVTGASREMALRTLADHLMPGRGDEVRANSRKELAATLVLRVPLERASVKVSAGPADDPDDGESREVWAGVVPLALSAGEPVPAGDVPTGHPAPPSAVGVARRFPAAR